MGCEQCSGTGWRYVTRGSVARCECQDRVIAQRMAQLASVRIDDPELRGFVEYLKEHCRGPKRALKAAELARVVFGLERLGGADRRLRALAGAATKAGIPVASGNSGYYLATAPEHLNEVIRRLQRQATKHFERADRLKSLQEALRLHREGAIWDEQAQAAPAAAPAAPEVLSLLELDTGDLKEPARDDQDTETPKA